MTDEERKLVEENINLVHKFCAMHHITDEDIKQDLMMEFCDKVCKWEPDRGTLGTFLFTVLKNKMSNIRLQESRHIQESQIVSFEESAWSDDDGSCKYEDVLGEEDESIEMVETREAFNQIWKDYKFHYPGSYVSDLEIYRGILNHKDKLKLAKDLGVPYASISSRFRRVQNFFKQCVRNNAPPKYVETPQDKMFCGENEHLYLNSEESNMLGRWLRTHIILVDRNSIILNTKDICEVAQKNLGFIVKEPDVRKALTKIEYRPIGENIQFNENWDLKISKKSPILNGKS